MKTQIRNNPGQSGYFHGGYKVYGLYQWNIKYYGWNTEYEVEEAQRWAFGEHVKNSVGYGFEMLSEIVRRPIKSGTDGRSGGWLVIDTELTEKELEKIDKHVSECMKGLPFYLKEEREQALAVDKRVLKAIKLIKEAAGSDAVLVIKGIKIL